MSEQPSATKPAPTNRIRDRLRGERRSLAVGSTKTRPGGLTPAFGGHGFALHTSILAARAMKGSLTALSDGLGKGAVFILELPIVPPASDAAGSGLAEFPKLNPYSYAVPATVV